MRRSEGRVPGKVAWLWGTELRTCL